jgi:hypothetical protein
MCREANGMGRNHVLNYRPVRLAWNWQGVAGLSPSKMPHDARQARSIRSETWNALDLLARDSILDFQELADEAFADLLKKHGQPNPQVIAMCLAGHAMGYAHTQAIRW